ncbi:unnamed protein product, partial [Prunus brigantina]
MRDLTASNEPTFTVTASTAPVTEPTCTAAPTVDNVCVAPLFTTFLVPSPESPHADILEEEVYMSLPLGYNALTDASVMCKLKNALYELKKNGKLTSLIIYADDMIVTSDDLDEIDKLKGYLASEFDMKDLSGLKYFLGIELTRSEHGIFLSQRKYVLDLLKETSMLGCEPIGTPIEQNHGLEEYPDQVPTNKGRYQRLVR